MRREGDSVSERTLPELLDALSNRSQYQMRCRIVAEWCDEHGDANEAAEFRYESDYGGKQADAIRAEILARFAQPAEDHASAYPSWIAEVEIPAQTVYLYMSYVKDERLAWGLAAKGFGYPHTLRVDQVKQVTQRNDTMVPS
jgi:hypothetical protein